MVYLIGNDADQWYIWLETTLTDGKFDWKRRWPMVYLIGNDADQWYIWLETTLTDGIFDWGSEEEIAEFLTKTERNKENKRKTYCSIDVFDFLRNFYKKNLFISWNRAEK